MHSRFVRTVAFCLSFSLVSLACLCSAGAEGIHPPAPGQQLPQAYFDLKAKDPTAFEFERAYLRQAREIRENQQRVSKGLPADPSKASAFTGTRAIPVLLGKFANTGSDPFPAAQLQQQLFDGPWPTGTMSEFYSENSLGAFTVTGTVFDWQTVPQNDTYYESTCNGLNPSCGAKTGEFIEFLLGANDPSVDFGQFDNDGPDGFPNSGDDDGYVDALMVAHAEKGGECGSNNIWSHRWVLSAWGNGSYVTDDPAFNGGMIRVQDYTMQPGLSCGSGMIEIGVWCHEYGHALGLPDLYDINGGSAGIGYWGVMGSGGWNTPSRPAHMSAWSKAQVGWVTPTVVCADQPGNLLNPVETTGEVLKIYPHGVEGPEYFLLEHRRRLGFDLHLRGEGLAIWHIDEDRPNNADENHKLVDLEEADGDDDLDAGQRGDSGDVYPGSAGATTFDVNTYPDSRDYSGFDTKLAVTSIVDTGTQMSFDLAVEDCFDPGQFVDVTAGGLAGIDFSEGVSWSDYDGDGDPDLYVVNEGTANRLFRNDGAGAFVDVATGVLADAAAGRAGQWGDVDNDGDPDLYLTNESSSNRLLRNDAGSFVDITAGPLGDTGAARGASWADYDRDGDIDLYLCNDGVNRLLRNDVSAFVDVTLSPLDAPANTYGAAWGDFDDDGDPDLYLVTNGGENQMLRNDAGSFIDVTAGPLGDAGTGRGASWADFDDDGDLDLHVANLSADKLLRNDGGVFADVTPSGMNAGSSLGSAWVDYDNDGDLDLYVGKRGTANKLFLNLGGGLFVGTSEGALGDEDQVRGLAFADYDADGDLDVYVANGIGHANLLLENANATGAHWLHVDLEGSLSNRSALGTRVELFAGGQRWMRELSDGLGYFSQGSPTVEFGLENMASADSLVISWPSGIVQTEPVPAVDTRMTVVESGMAVTTIPPGLDIIVDGVTYTSPRNFAWTPGSTHTIEVPSPQVVVAGETRLVFDSWNDGGAQSHTITAPVGTFAFVAQMQVQHTLDVTAGPGGTALPALAWYDAGTTVAISATPDPGNLFHGWVGSGLGSYTGCDAQAMVTLHAPLVQQASFGPTSFTDASTAETDAPFEASDVVWGQADRFGFQDLYLVNRTGANRLLRNDGPGALVDITPALLADAGTGMAASLGDLNNDYNADLYLVNSGTANRLFQGSFGQFSEVTGSDLGDAGLGRDVVWIDYDGDRNMDLYVVNDGANVLLDGDGTGTFTDVTSGAAGDAGAGAAVAPGDFDDDGDLDLYVVNTGSANVLLRNDQGVFVDGTMAPLNDPGPGRTGAWADFDNDGDLDLFLGQSGVDRLFRQDAGTFVDVTPAGLAVNLDTRSADWADYDLDGDIDLYVGYDGAANVLAENQGGGVFAVASPQAAADPTASVQFADADWDGDPDLFVANDGGDNVLLSNVGCLGNHWIELSLYASSSNTFGIGARIRVVAGGISQLREVTLFKTALFGLGAATVVDTLEVTWPSGIVTTETGLAADQLRTVTELVPVDVVSVPSGLEVLVDEEPYTTPARVNLLPFTIHNFSGRSQQPTANTRYLPAGWDTGFGLFPDSTVAVLIFTNSATYTAFFDTEHRLTMDMQGSGTLLPGTSWQPADSTVVIEAIPDASALFGGWTGTGGGSYTGPDSLVSVTMSEPLTQTALFVSATAVPSATQPRVLRLRPAWPNPAAGTAWLGFELPRAAHVELDVVDLRGRRVARLLSESYSSGVYQLPWAGIDDNGRPLAGGVYFYVLRVGDEERVGKVVLVR